MKDVFVFRPNGICDYIYPVKEITNTHAITTGMNIKLSIIDSGKSYYGNYYFSSQEKETQFIKQYYNKRKEL